MAFGVGSGTTLFDKSRYRSHGAITGASWATGAHGKCLDFEGADNDYVDGDDTSDQLDFTTDKFSVVMRVNLESLTANRTSISRTTGSDKGWWTAFRTDGDFWVATGNASGVQESKAGAGSIVIATWYTVGFSRDGASVLIYINGVETMATAAVHVDPVTVSVAYRLGDIWVVGSQPFDGKIEFLRVFGGIALAASEHLAWHNALV